MRKRLNSKLAISLGLGIPEISDALQSSIPLATEASREAHLRGYGICKTRAHTWVTPGVVRCVGRRIREYSATSSDLPWDGFTTHGLAFTSSSGRNDFASNESTRRPLLVPSPTRPETFSFVCEKYKKFRDKSSKFRFNKRHNWEVTSWSGASLGKVRSRYELTQVAASTRISAYR